MHNTTPPPELEGRGHRLRWLLGHYDDLDDENMLVGAVDTLPWLAVEVHAKDGTMHRCMLHGTAHLACLELAENVRKGEEWWPKALHYLDGPRWHEPIDTETYVTVEAQSDDIHATGSTREKAQVTRIDPDDPRFMQLGDDDGEADWNEGPVID